MNSRTAKQLARASSALALVNVVQAEQAKPEAQRLDAESRAQVIHLTANATYKRLKARWKGTPRKERAAMRRRLVALTSRTSHALAQASA